MGIELVVMLAMIAFNSIFAAYEIALAAISAGRLHLLSEEGRPGAQSALFMKENVEKSLAAMQLGITLFAAIAAATGGAGASEGIEPYYRQELNLSPGWAEFLAVATVVAPLTAATIVFGELVPKVFALRNQEWVCLKLSPPMRWFTYTAWPLVWLFESIVSAVTDWGQKRFRGAPGDAKPEAVELQELRAAAALARTRRLIGPREEGIIIGASRLSSRPVREIIVPAAAIGMLPADGPIADALVLAHLDMHTRFPVTERAGDPEGIIGYVNFKDIVAVMRLSPQTPALRSVVRPLVNFRDSDAIIQCLERLIQSGAHIALVRDAAARVAGMVTLEDIVEELLGDIRDEYDRLPAHITPLGAGWTVGGAATIEQFKGVSGIDLTVNSPMAATTTLSDWVSAQLARPVRAGDVLERSGVRVLVRKVRQHVLEAHIMKAT